MKQERPETVAIASLRVGLRVNAWVVEHCPFCGRRHCHGAGPADADPRQYLGHRVAHCHLGGRNHSYRLVEA